MPRCSSYGHPRAPAVPRRGFAGEFSAFPPRPWGATSPGTMLALAQGVWRSSQVSASTRLARLCLSLACLGLVAGCTSRTLPLPPPTVDSIEAPNAQGLVLVTGSAQDGAAIGVLNERTNSGVIVTSNSDQCDRTCPFEATLAAEPGDPLRIWQFFETGSSLERYVPE